MDNIEKKFIDQKIKLFLSVSSLSFCLVHYHYIVYNTPEHERMQIFEQFFLSWLLCDCLVQDQCDHRGIPADLDSAYAKLSSHLL